MSKRRYYYRDTICAACSSDFTGWIDPEAPDEHLCSRCAPVVCLTGVPMVMRSFGGHDPDLGYVRSRAERDFLLKEKGLIDTGPDDLPHLERVAARNKRENMDKHLSKYDDALGRAVAALERDEDPIPAFEKEVEAL